MQPPIIDHKTYEGDRWSYGFRNRPPGFAHNPKGFIYGSEGTHVDFPRYGTLDYPRALTKEEVYSYELRLVKITLTSDRSWYEVLYRAVHRWYARPLQPKYYAFHMLLSTTSNEDDLDMSTLWFAQQVDESRWELTPAGSAEND